MPALRDFSATTIDGREVELSEFHGQVVLVVNTASRCGFTPQFEGLQHLHKTYHDRGFTVLGFPCDQFAEQELGTADEIAEFCQTNYGVTFPMFEKVDVNGPDAHPVFEWLRRERGGLLGDRLKWNFTKFLIGRDGRVLKRYPPTTSPERLTGDVERALGG